MPMSYLEKIVKAIRAERNHLGSFRQAIAKYLKAEFDSDNKAALRKALKQGVKKGKLSQTGARFRVLGDKEIAAPDDGFKQKDLLVGEGREAIPGSVVTVAYKGKLLDGTVFDSAKKFVFALGEGDVIKGWDRGVKGMRVGGKRKLLIPPALGYGKRGALPEIPGDAVLKFTVKLLKVEK